LERLRALPFVKRLNVRRDPRPDIDGRVEIRTPEGTYTLIYELKQTFLDKALTNATIARVKALERNYGLNTIVLAPYIPRPTGEILAAAEVNFIDRYGNLHVNLGQRYHALVLGRVRTDRYAERRRTGPATVQVLLTFLANREAANWPVRQIAETAGVGKTIAADVRRRLVEEDIFEALPRKRYRLADPKQLEQRWLVGYSELLRPRLLLGVYRGPFKDQDFFVRELARRWDNKYGNWALTGGGAAYALQQFYRGNRTQIFTAGLPLKIREQMQLVEDTGGPITFLRQFAPLVFWRRVGGLPVAHPWLVFAELLLYTEPRALEAAERFYDEFLRGK